MTYSKTVLNCHDAQLLDFDHQIKFDDHLKFFSFQNDNLWHLLKSLAKLIRRSLVLKSWSTPAPTLVCSLEHTMIKTRKIRIHVDSVHSSQFWCDCQWKRGGIIARMIAIHTEWSRWGRSAFMLTPPTLLSEKSSKSRHNANHWRRQVEIFALCSSSWLCCNSGWGWWWW